MSQNRKLLEVLIAEIKKQGYPEEFALVLANELRGEWSMKRMIGYLRQVKHAPMEEIVDEMLAIQQDVQTIRTKKIMESNQASYNMMLQYGIDKSVPKK